MNDSLPNIPNSLTILRIILIPVFVIMFYFPASWTHVVTSSIFAIAAFTDWLDGYLARKLKQESPFGAFLDPVADKLLVAVALVLLVGSHGTPLLAIPASIIVGREIVISALREWMAEIGKSTSVKVSYIGKVKTVAQMLAIILLLSQAPVLSNNIIIAGYVLLYCAAALTLWSMIIYIRAAWKCFDTES